MSSPTTSAIRKNGGSQVSPSPRPPISASSHFADGALSQWQLIKIRFSRHRLGRVSLDLVIFLYLMAMFSEFFAPHATTSRDLELIYCPPQLPKISFSEGIYCYGWEARSDPVTLQRRYVLDRETILPLSFFVRGDPYRLWGLFSAERHFFGIDRDRYASALSGGPGVQHHKAKGEHPAVHFFGTDKYGRDILSRMISGARISLSIGFVAIVITLALGVTVGGVSGYAGGGVDNFIQRSIEIINAFPQLPLWLALGAVMPKDWSGVAVYFAITVVLSLLGWTGLARVVRGKILSLRDEDYAVAARLMGAGHGRIIFRHLIPGFTSHIIVTVTLTIPGMILGETALSFLGLGLRPPVVSWGVMLQDCMNIQVLADYPWMLAPLISIIATVLAFNFLGDGLRDAADPYSG